MDQEISKSFSISGRNSWFSVCLTTVVSAVLPEDIEWYRCLSATDRRWSKSTTNLIEIPPNSKSSLIFIRRECLSLQPNKCFPITKASSIINDLTPRNLSYKSDKVFPFSSQQFLPLWDNFKSKCKFSNAKV